MPKTTLDFDLAFAPFTGDAHAHYQVLRTLQEGESRN